MRQPATVIALNDASTWRRKRWPAFKRRCSRSSRRTKELVPIGTPQSRVASRRCPRHDVAVNEARVTRVFADANGETHFEDVVVPLESKGAIGNLSERHPVASVIFRSCEPGYDFDFHCAPERQYLVILDGSAEVTVSDGERREFTAGDVLLLDDTEGRGHRTRTTSEGVRRTLFIPLAPES